MNLLSAFTRIRTSFVAIVAIALLAPLSVSGQTTLKFSWFGPPVADFNREGIFPWGKEIEKATNGKVKIEFLAKSAGSAQAHFDLAKDGIADMVYFMPGIVPGRFVLHQAAEFPFNGDRASEMSIAYWRIYEKHFAKANEYAGVKILTGLTHGPGLIHNSKRPIRSMADFAGLKMRVPTETVGTLAKALGAVPMYVPLTQIPEVLSNGVADGVFVPFNSIADMKLHNVLRHTTVVPGGLYNTTFHVAVNEGKWNRLPKADQEAILSISGEKAARFIGKSWEIGDANGRKLAEEGGVQVIAMDPAFRASVAKEFEPQLRAWIAAAKKKGVDGEAALKDLQRELATLR